MTPEALLEALLQAEQGAVWAAARKQLLRVGLKAQGRAVSLVRERLGTRTGALARSIVWRMRQDEPGEVELELLAGAGDQPIRYAQMQEEGGEVRPVRAQMLRIPLPAAKTGAGVDRLGGPLRATAPDRFRVQVAGDGRLYLIDKDTEIPWYLLRRAPVRITGRHFMRDAVDEARSELLDLLGVTVTSAVKGGT